MKRKKIIIFGAVVLILVTALFAVGVWFFHSSFYILYHSYHVRIGLEEKRS